MMTLVAVNCSFLNSEESRAIVKCAVNPTGDCQSCKEFESPEYQQVKEFKQFPSKRLIERVVCGVETAEYIMDTGRGKYRVCEKVGACVGGRNTPDNVCTVHSWRTGAPYKDSSFYGNYTSLEEAALAAIRMYRIVAVDDQGRAVCRKEK